LSGPKVTEWPRGKAISVVCPASVTQPGPSPSGQAPLRSPSFAMVISPERLSRVTWILWLHVSRSSVIALSPRARSAMPAMSKAKKT